MNTKLNEFFNHGINNKSKKIVLDLLIISILISTNFFISDYYRSSIENIVHNADDPIHVNIAKNFYENGNFNLDFTLSPQNPETTIAQYPMLPAPQDGKGPIYYIFLGSFYSLLGTSDENLVNHGSMFNTLLISIFLTLYYILIRYKFNFTIAVISSFLVVTIPYMGFTSSRILLYPLLFIFLTLAFFFLKEEKKYYIIFGVLAGLIHLTHPFGIYLGTSYVIFLLLKKQFKGSLIVFLSWNIVLIPWFIRNYFHFGDIGRGLWLPFGEKFNYILSFFPQREELIQLPARIPYSKIDEISEWGLPYDMFKNLYQLYFVEIHQLEFLLIFIILFSVFVFFSSHYLKEKLKYKIFMIGIFIIIYLLVPYLNNPIIQWSVIFITPIIFIFIIQKKLPDTGEIIIPRHFQFILLLSFVNLMGLTFYWLISDIIVPDIKQIMFVIMMIIPIAVLGLQKIINKLLKFFDVKHMKLISVITIILISFPIGMHQLDATENVIDYYHKSKKTINLEINTLHNFAKTTIPYDSIVISNQPFLTNSELGLKSIDLPSNIVYQKDLDTLVSHYGISYMLFYSLGDYPGNVAYKTLINENPGDYYFADLFSVNNSHIISVKKISESDISEPILYVIKAKKLSELNQTAESIKILNEIQNNNFQNSYIRSISCEAYTIMKLYDKAELECSKAFQLNPDGRLEIFTFINLYLKQNDMKNALNILHEAQKLFIISPNPEFGNIIDSGYAILLKYDPLPVKLELEYKLELAKGFETNRNYEQSKDYYNSIKILKHSFPKIASDATIGEIRVQQILEENKEKPKTLNLINEYINVIQSEIEYLHSKNNFVVSLEKEKELFAAYKLQISFFQDIGETYEIERTINKILVLDRADYDTWVMKGKFLENNQRYEEAIAAFSQALRDPERYDELQIKINKLKEIISTTP